ncbi:MAG: zinc-binding dehydrogenase, partial [Halioglobus sp.]|nr:zinc-binding dehydrogenase [Halioglobus sp.]
GETLLVHGGSSGIGSTAIQLAVAHGSNVIVTAGSDAKCRFCESLGAVAINYRESDWAEAVAAHCGSVDVVLDMVAGTYVQKNIDLLGRDGRYCLIAFLDGPTATVNLRRILTHRLTMTGSTLRPQTIAEKAAIAAELRTHVLPLLASGQVAPVIYRRFSLQDAHAAHELMESGEHMGKIVLLTDSTPS